MQRILGEIISIMKMNDAFVVSVYNIVRQQKASGDVRAGNTRQIIPLGRYDSGVFVGIFVIPVFIFTLDQFFDGLVRCVGFSYQFPGITVSDIFFSQLIFAQFHQLLLNDILNILYQDSFFVQIFNVMDNIINIFIRNPLFYFVVGFTDSDSDLFGIIIHNMSVSFYDFQFFTLLLLYMH